MDKAEYTRQSRRLGPIIILIVAGVALSAAGYFVADGLTRTADRNRFEKEANFVFNHLETRIAAALSLLHSVSGLFAASEKVERQEFGAFIGQLGEMPSVQALEWIPRVRPAARRDLEDAARRDGYPGFSFTERGPDGRLVPAGDKDEYFPVYYVEPYAGNEAALGFDLASNDTRLAALLQARDSGELFATARISLVQEKGDQYGFLVFTPVYRQGPDLSTVAARRDNLEGFGLGVFRVGNLVADAARSNPAFAFSIAIEILDRSAPAGSQRLYPKSAPGDLPASRAEGLYATRELNVGGRTWLIAASPGPAAAGAAALAWQGWAVFLTGLTFTGLTAVFYYQVLNRTTVVEKLVEERTAQLRDSEARMQAVIETAVDAVITINARGIVQSFNPAAERMFGYEAAECTGRNVSMLMPDPDHSAHDGYLANYLKSGDRKIIGIGREVVGLRKNGESFPMDLSVGEFRVADRTMFAGICRDATARRRNKRELEEGREILRSLADNVPDFISLKDPDGRFQFVNKRFEEWVCLSREDVIGKTVHDIYTEDQAIEIETLDRKAIKERIVISRELYFRYPDGDTRTVISTRFPVISADGDMLGLGTVDFDITEHRRVQEDIAAVNKELESFAYSVSHDLRAPLRGIDGFSQALVEDYGDKLDDDARQYIRRIRAGAQHMGQLIDDMLALSRVTRREMKREPVDLAALANDVVKGLRETDPDRNVVFEVSSGLKAHGDERLLRILLENLIGNAWKFTPGAEDARIELGSATAEGELVFHVRDNGAGFDMAYADKLFEPFQRLHSVTEFEGTGVGLATVARIIQRHGGRIWAEGAVGKGATIYFTLSSADNRGTRN